MSNASNSAPPPCKGTMNSAKTSVFLSALRKTTSLAITTLAVSPVCQRNHSCIPLYCGKSSDRVMVRTRGYWISPESSRTTAPAASRSGSRVMTATDRSSR